MTDSGKSWRWLWGVLALGAVLRLVAARYGLPAVFNADEPHVVDVAVSFGSGTLNPHLFKYPTLWMYVLFAAYGIYFLVWSAFGLLHTVRQFGELFAWDPTGFYLIARILSSVASLWACERVYRTGKLYWGPRAGLLAAGFLAVSPLLSESSNSAKMDQCMLLFAAWATWFAARYLKEGADRDLLLCGLAVGLASSTQYTAAPLGVIVPCAWLARRWGTAPLTDKRGLALLAGACALVPAGLLLGSPFIAIDFKAFWGNIQDNLRMESTGKLPVGLLHLTRNLLGFPDSGIPAWGAAAIGAAVLCRNDRRRAFLFLAAPLVYALLLSRSAQGGTPRYSFAAYPAVAAIVGVGADALIASASAVPAWAATAVVAAVLWGPGAWNSAAYDRFLLLPDSRTLAARWIEEHVPAGTAVLLDQEHASPRLAYSRACVERLLAQTRASGHPRRRYYDYMLSGQREGGYDVYRVRRDYRDLLSWPGHVAFSEAGQPVLDVGAGLAPVRAAGVKIVVLSSFGATHEHSPYVEAFLSGTEKEGRLLAEFAPKPGEIGGPDIRIFELPPAPRSASARARRK